MQRSCFFLLVQQTQKQFRPPLQVSLVCWGQSVEMSGHFSSYQADIWVTQHRAMSGPGDPTQGHAATRAWYCNIVNITTRWSEICALCSFDNSTSLIVRHMLSINSYALPLHWNSRCRLLNWWLCWEFSIDFPENDKSHKNTLKARVCL